MAMSKTAGMLAAAITVATALALGAAVPSYASSTTARDPKGDVFLASAGGGIDLAAVRLKTLDRKTRIQITFALHARAQEGSLDRPGGMAAQFIKNQRTSRVVRVVTRDGNLSGEVCSDIKGDQAGPRKCRSLPVTQVDEKTYRVTVKLKQIKKGAEVLRWTAWSIDLSNGDPVSDWVTAKNRRPHRWRL